MPGERPVGILRPGRPLTIYPIGVDRTGRRWRPKAEGAPDASWFEPAQPMTTHLMEPPITIR